MIDWNKPIKPKDLGSWKYKYLGRVEPNTRRLIEASHEGQTTFYITVDDSGKYEFNDKYTVENLPPPAPREFWVFEYNDQSILGAVDYQSAVKACASAIGQKKFFKVREVV